MADNVNITAGSGTAIATHDLSANGGTGQAQKIWALAGSYICTGSDVNITVSTTAVMPGNGLTVPANTSHMFVTVESGDVRFREDGVSPSATNGCLLAAGSADELPIPTTAANLRFIKSATSATAAVLNISYRSYR